MEKILKLKAVIDTTGLKRSSIYKGIQNGDFPKPVRLGARAVGWAESSVQRWIQSRIDAAQKVSQ